MNARGKHCASPGDVVVVGMHYMPPQVRWEMELGQIMHDVVVNMTKNFEERVRKETGKSGFAIHRENVNDIFLSSQTAGSSIGKGGHTQWGTLFAEWFGYGQNIQQYGKSLDAIQAAIMAIRNGSNTVYVVAVEKKSDEQNLVDSSSKSIDPTLRIFNWDWQSIYANMAFEYFIKTQDRYQGTTRKEKFKAFYNELMAIGFNDRYNAGTSTLKDIIDSGKKMASRTSYDPLTAFDFAENEVDGGCAMMLMPKRRADEIGVSPLATIHCAVSRTNSSEFWMKDNMIEYPALKSAAQECYWGMGITTKDIDVFSIDTKVTIAGPLVLEGLGVLEYPSVPTIAKTVYKAMDPNYPYKHILFEREDGSHFIVNPTGVSANLPGVNGAYQTIKVIEKMRGACKPLEVDGQIALIQEQSAGGEKQNILLLEVNK